MASLRPIDLLSSSSLTSSSSYTSSTTSARPQYDEHIVQLHPILNNIEGGNDSNNEVIACNTGTRPIITIKSTDAAPTVLGRNQTTKIADVTLSRAICDVYVTTEGIVKLQMRKKANSHKLYINDEPVLADLMEEVILTPNCHLCLSEDRYEYKLVVPDRNQVLATAALTTAALTTTASASSSSSVVHHQQQALSLNHAPYFEPINGSSSNNENSEPPQLSAARRLMVDELTCALCMEIMVRAHATSPCGHMLCGPCADQLVQNNKTNTAMQTLRRLGPVEMMIREKHGLTTAATLAPCPHCREGITGVTWMRSLDNVIWGMVLCGDYFEEDDVRHYLDRSGKNPTKEEMDLIFKKKTKKPLNNIPAHYEEQNQSLPPMKKRKMMNISTTYLEDSSSREITTEAEDRKMPAINISSQTPPPPPLPTTPLLIDLNVGNCNDDAICID